MMTAEAVFMVGVATVRPDLSTRVSLDRHFAASPDVNDTLTRGDKLIFQEYFIKHFMEEGYTKARLDRRKLVTYKDIGE